MSFEGAYRRLPVQSLGGIRVTPESIDKFLLNAQYERQRREEDRLRLVAIKKIQGIARGVILRSRMRDEASKNYFTKYSSSSAPPSTIEQLSDKLGLFSKMCQPLNLRDEILAQFSAISNNLKACKGLLINNLEKDPLLRAKITRFFIYGLGAVETCKEESGFNMRLMSAALDFFKMLKELSTISESLLNFYSNLYLVSTQVCPNIFTLWHSLLMSISLKSTNQELLSQISQNFTHPLSFFSQLLKYQPMVLRLPLNIKTSHRNRVKNVSAQRTSYFEFYSTYQLGTILLHQFTTFFIENAIKIPLSSEIEGRENLGLALIRKNLHCFPHAFWYNFLKSVFIQNVIKENYELAQKLFYLVILLRPKKLDNELRDGFLEVMSFLIPFIELRKDKGSSRGGYLFMCEPGVLLQDEDEISQSTLNKYREGDEDDEDDDEEMELDSENIETNSDKIALQILTVNEFDEMELEEWVDLNNLENWTLVRPVLSFLLQAPCTELKSGSYFIQKFIQHHNFLNNLWKKILASGELNSTDGAIFSCLLGANMLSLHDSLLLSNLPKLRESLADIVSYLLTLHSNLILNESNESSSQDIKNSFEDKAITKCLKRIHSRNNILNLLKEDVFISSPLTRRSESILATKNPLTFAHLTEYEEDSRRNSAKYKSESRSRKLIDILASFPFSIPFKMRVEVLGRMIESDRDRRMERRGGGTPIVIRRNYVYEDTFALFSSNTISDIRNPIRITFRDELGVMEAGIDGGGVFREFLTLATKAAFNPNFGLFRLDTQNRLYPNPVAHKVVREEASLHYYTIGRLVGKGIYEGVLVELPLSPFFLQKCITKFVGRASDYLSTLDPHLHKQLLSIQSHSSDYSALGLDFTIAVEELGVHRTVELKPNGSSISVNKSNVIEYIHLVCEYKINKEVEFACDAFRAGLLESIPVTGMFSWAELQILISGSDTPIDISDWRAFTNYNGLSPDHPAVTMFWRVVETLSQDELRKLLKFVTSSSRPPLLGFRQLDPNFGIQFAGAESIRLPTAATCMNLLKLPEYPDIETLREKLIYAINDESGFQLS